MSPSWTCKNYVNTFDCNTTNLKSLIEEYDAALHTTFYYIKMELV